MTLTQIPLKSHHLIAQNYELILTKTIDESPLHSVTSATSSSSSLSTLYELIQARPNPPLETIWVYSALAFSNKFPSNEKLSERVSALNDLFGLVSGFAASCSSSKSIGLLAPVLYEVYRVIVEVKGNEKEFNSKKVKKLFTKIKSLVDSILGFISLCCGNDDESDSGLDSDEFIRPLGELVSVWIGNGSGGDLEEKEKLGIFFPILSYEIVGLLSRGRIGACELAGAVITEVFLLRFCLDLSSGVSEKELKAWAIGSITGFRNFNFFETLLRMLLEQHLPFTSVLNSEDEVSLRKILYDAVILVDYSFSNLDQVIHLSAKRVITVSILRVLVTCEAIESFRKKGDHSKALSYANAFSSSQLPFHIVKFIRNEFGIESEADQPKALSPKAILKWLHNLEDQGIKLLDDSIPGSISRLALDISEAENELSEHRAEGERSDPDLLFYIDSKGEGEDSKGDDEQADESVNAAFVAAARTMKSAESKGEKKRKGGKSLEKKKQVKFQKYDLYNEAEDKSSNVINEELNSESEVENPDSDDEIEGK